jgi:hypothetical protein
MAQAAFRARQIVASPHSYSIRADRRNHRECRSSEDKTETKPIAAVQMKAADNAVAFG